MLEIVLPWVALVGVMGALAVLGVRWALERVERSIVDKYRAAECVVNEGRVPEAWTGGYRERIAKLRAAGASRDDLEEVGRRAQEHCLRELDALVRVFQTSRAVDSEDTRRVLLDALQQRRDQWATESWEALIEAGLPHSDACPTDGQHGGA